ncbi:MAG: hypothetical protein L0Z51_06350 [Candidatus Latescibacteria bacterium]|nr:hypothetical protein [Candidatus Latescibacterota bacterium]
MTSLMGGVRRTTVRRWTTGIVAGSLLAALAGCEEDRASNADDRKPIAVTASGVEIMEVVRNENERIVEAVVVAGGEERRVTFAPVLDGPLSHGMTAVVSTSRDGGGIEMSFGWDEQSGASWVRQRSGTDSFEFSRVVVQNRVVEDYMFNGRTLQLQYADLPPLILEKATAKYLRGEPLESTSPEVKEFATQLRAFQAFADQLPSAFTSPNDDSALLTSLLGDPVFVSTVTKEPAPNSAFRDAVCATFNTCVAVFCRMNPVSHICGVCAAGSLACLFTIWFCTVMCG